MSNSLNLIPVGKVLKAHGIKGELKFFLYNCKSNLLLKKIKIWFENEGQLESFNLISSRGSNGEIVKLKKINNRDEAELFKGKQFFVNRSDFPEVEDGNFYLNDVIDFKVVYEGKEIGLISDVFSLPSGNMIEIGINGKDFLIPMIDEYLELFDFDKKMVVLKNIKDLINL